MRQKIDENIILLQDYIRKLYDPVFYFQGWDLEANYREESKDYTEAILRHMRSKINESSSEIETCRLLKTCLEAIANGLRHFPFRQMSGIQLAFCVLLENKKLPDNNFDSLPIALYHVISTLSLNWL